MKISIRYKFLGVLGILLLTAVCCYTWLASSIIAEDKTHLLYDLNHNIAVNTAAQIRTSVFRLADQIKLFVISQSLKTDAHRVELPVEYLKEAGIIGLKILHKKDEAYEAISQRGIASEFLDQNFEQKISEIAQSKLRLWSDPKNHAHFYLGTQVEVVVSDKLERYIALAEIEPWPIFQTLESTSLYDSYLAEPSGEVLVHYDRNQLMPSRNIAGHPLLEGETKGTSGVKTFEFDKKIWYGAYAPLGISNLMFLSQADRGEVQYALNLLAKRSGLFGLIVITLTFLASILFSKRLTHNLALLTLRTKEVSDGDLSTPITIRSRDEIGDLAVSFNQMISDLKKSKEALERYNEELEKKVEERTLELKEKNIAIKEAQEALLNSTQLAAAGEVAGRTAHEVLNPLTSLMGRLESTIQYLESIEEKSFPEEFRAILNAWSEEFQKVGINGLLESFKKDSLVLSKATLLEEDIQNLKKLADFWEKQRETVNANVHAAQRQAQRIHKIVNQMRDLVRKTTNKKDTSCHAAVHDSIQTLSDFVSKYGVTFKETLSAKNDIAFVDRDELIQIMTNLLRNSFQAIKERTEKNPGAKKEIVIETGNEEGKLWIEVKDQGIGISPENQPRLFEQGFSTKPPTEGTGLGLAICRRFARDFSGDVSFLYSEPESRGTCFRVVIPLQQG